MMAMGKKGRFQEEENKARGEEVGWRKEREKGGIKIKKHVENDREWGVREKKKPDG